VPKAPYETLDIKSHKGTYTVHFVPNVADIFSVWQPGSTFHYIIDKKVLDLYKDRLMLPKAASVLAIEATETNKNLNKMPEYIAALLKSGAKRDHTLIAIGGGIVQDISCFLAATLFRGMRWCFLPTTLLAQTDSCIGSKSSINVGDWKNIVGTFTPPNEIIVAAEFLNTLTPDDLRSGIGEMLKVHMIHDLKSFNAIAGDYEKLMSDSGTRLKYIHRSLGFKKTLIEEDEFDRGVRQILNYGHSFGHAIESATEFAVPHGIAVTIGMDMANYVAFRMGRWSEMNFASAHPVLRANSGKFVQTPVPLEGFMSAIGKDKKNIGAMLTLVLPSGSGKLERVGVAADETFKSYVKDYFTSGVRA
jgi:3-dehydroquinate synthase